MRDVAPARVRPPEHDAAAAVRRAERREPGRGERGLDLQVGRGGAQGEAGDGPGEHPVEQRPGLELVDQRLEGGEPAGAEVPAEQRHDRLARRRRRHRLCLDVERVGHRGPQRHRQREAAVALDVVVVRDAAGRRRSRRGPGSPRRAAR